MKKLLLVAVTALCSVATWAQKPTYTYSMPTQDVEYYLYNVETNTFFCAGNDWGTRASVTAQGPGLKVKIMDQSAGLFTLANNKSADFSTHLDCDGNKDSWVDGQGRVGDGKWSMDYDANYIATLYNYQAGEGQIKWGVSPDLSNTRIRFADDATATSWAFITPENYEIGLNAFKEAQLASTVKGTEVGFAFDNLNPANPSNGGWKTPAGWTIETEEQNGAFHVNTWSNEGNSDGSNMTTPFFERWVGGGATLNPCKMYTELTGLLPNSTYNISALFRVLYENGGVEVNGVEFYANEKSVDVCAKGTTMEKGIFGNALVSATSDENGKIVLGVNVLDGTTASWVTWKNIKVVYMGKGVTAEEIEALIATAPTGAMAKNEAIALEQAIEAGRANPSADTYAALEEAINNAKTSAQLFEKAANVLAQMKKLTENNNLVTEAAYNTYYKQWADKYEDGTITTAELNALKDPYAAAGWHSSITYDDYLLSTWQIGEAQCADYTTGLYINTWSTEGNNDGSNFKVPFFEYWTGDANSLGTNTLKSTNTVMPGEVTVEVDARVRIKNDGGEDAYGISFSVNGGEALDACAGEQIGDTQFRLIHLSKTVTVGADGHLEVAFDIAEDNNISWLSFENVKYTYAPVVASADRSDWRITAPNTCPTGYENSYDGHISAAIDDSPTTFYHSDWSESCPTFGNSGLQGFLIDMAESTEILGFTYAARENSASGHAYTARVYVFDELPQGLSMEGMSEMTADEKESVLSASNANIANYLAFNNADTPWSYDANTDVQTGMFDKAKTGRYILFVQDTGYDAWLTCADFNVLTEVDEIEYTVSVTGASGLGADYAGKRYYDGDVIAAKSEIKAEDITPMEDENAAAKVTINGRIINIEYIMGMPVYIGGYTNIINVKKADNVQEAVDEQSGWYLITQKRGTETPLYHNTSMQVFRDASKTAESFIGAEIKGNEQYLVRFIPTDEQGIYRMQFADESYMTSATNPITASTDLAESAKMAFYNINGEAGHFGWNIGSKEGDIVDNNGNGYKLNTWGSGEVTTTGGNNDWYIYEVTLGHSAQLTVGEGSYATFYAPFDVELPEGVTAYSTASTEENGTTLVLREIGSSTLNMGTPVILYSEAAVDSTILGVAFTESLSDTNGWLHGVLTETQAQDGWYVLQNHNGDVAFWEVQQNTAQPVVPANRCYLLPEGDSQEMGVKAFTFAGSETAIKAIDALSNGKAEIYDINGRKLNKLQKGVNIVNGVKVLVK